MFCFCIFFLLFLVLSFFVCVCFVLLLFFPVKHSEYLGLNEINKLGENGFLLSCHVGECTLMLFIQPIYTVMLTKASLIIVARRSSADHQHCSSATADVSQTPTCCSSHSEFRLLVWKVSPEEAGSPRCATDQISPPTQAQISHLLDWPGLALPQPLDQSSAPLSIRPELPRLDVCQAAVTTWAGTGPKYVQRDSERTMEETE